LAGINAFMIALKDSPTRTGAFGTIGGGIAVDT
jgi:hypothetical protein